jgi:hypothetical protein
MARELKLSELEPQFLRYSLEGGRAVFHHVDDIAEAQGLIFLCPKCFAENRGAVGTHSILCWSRSRGVPEDASPGPGRWTLEGTGYADLTMNGDSPKGPGTGKRSVLLTAGCRWHGYITRGRVTDA